MTKSFFTILLFAMFTSCSNSQTSPTAVGEVDLEKYAGLWYDFASFPASFQKGCHCTTAEYLLTGKNYIRVINKCRRNSTDGKESGVRGRAYPVKGSNNTKLRVQFFWPFRADYDIIMLDKDYNWAVVSSGKKFLWVLSRSPELNEDVFQHITAKLRELGYDTERLQRTIHGCN